MFTWYTIWKIERQIMFLIGIISPWKIQADISVIESIIQKNSTQLLFAYSLPNTKTPKNNIINKPRIS